MTNLDKSFIINADDAIATRIFSKWMVERYGFSIDKVYNIENETISKILEDKESFKESLIVKNSNRKHFILYNEEVLFLISKQIINSENEKSSIYAEIYAKDFKSYKKWYEYLQKIDDNAKNKNFNVEYHSFSMGQFGLDSKIEYFKPDKFKDISSVFYEFYIDTDLLFESFLNSKAPILQLTGKPGIGKSKLIALFIKYLIEHKEYLINENKLKIARVASNEVLAIDEFWVKLRQGGFNALILDDLDNILNRRVENIASNLDVAHNESIKKLLTFTDGIDNTKTKILISTNLSYRNIDEALLRDMRLFDSLELRALKFNETKEIWVKHYGLNEDDFNKIFKDKNEITAATLMRFIEDIKGLKEEDNVYKRAYLKEEGISKLKDLREQKRKVGFIR